jgi:hypothetical protein
MKNYFFDEEVIGQARIDTSWQRLRNQSTWLLTLVVRFDHGAGGGGPLRTAFPQAHAVMDDYGTLVCVTPWN